MLKLKIMQHSKHLLIPVSVKPDIEFSDMVPDLQ